MMREPTLSDQLTAIRAARAALRTRPPKMRDAELEQLERAIDAAIKTLESAR